MKQNGKYLLIATLAMVLSYCSGNKARVFDPTGGQGYQTAQQYATQPWQPVRPSTRDQNFSVNYSDADYQRCYEEARSAHESGSELSNFCYELLYVTADRNGILAYAPEQSVRFNFGGNPTMVAGANENAFSYTLDWQDFENGNRSFVDQYRAGLTKNFNGGYQYPVNMQRYCQDPSYITTMQHSHPCGQLNYHYAVINMQMNDGYNYWRQGDYNRAARYYGPSGVYQKKLPHMYSYYQGSVISRRDVGKENAALQKNMEKSWENVKGLPKNWGLRIADRLMDVPVSMGERFITGIEANLSRMSASNYAGAGMNQEMTAYYDYVAATAYDVDYMSGSTLVQATADQPCPPNKFEYVVGATPNSSNEYKVYTCK